MSIQIAQYQGKSLLSDIIRWLTYSCYSHSSILFTKDVEVDVNGKMHLIPAGSVFEAWKTGVRLTESINEYHCPSTRVDLFEFKHPLTDEQVKTVTRCLIQHLGTKYSWWNVCRFVPLIRLLLPQPMPFQYTRKHVYCSELVCESLAAAGVLLLERCKFFEVPPRDIARSPLLYLKKTVYTA
jgi:hypothetical protein